MNTVVSEVHILEAAVVFVDPTPNAVIAGVSVGMSVCVVSTAGLWVLCGLVLEGRSMEIVTIVVQPSSLSVSRAWWIVWYRVV